MCGRGFRGGMHGTGDLRAVKGSGAMKKLLIAVMVLGGALAAGYLGAITQSGAVTQSGAGQNGGAANKTTPPAGQSAQESQEADRDIALLRKDIRNQKRQIIDTKVPLTQAEADKFWPVYDQYTAELVEINNVKYTLIKSYTDSYETMTDAQADEWSTRMLKLDADVAALRQKYWPKFRKVLSGKKTALYVQVERRTQMVIDAHLASEFPLVQPQR